MANTAKDRRAGKSYRQNDKGSGMAVPVPINNGPEKKYQWHILTGNGNMPANPYKGIVTRNKKLPGPPDNLA